MQRFWSALEHATTVLILVIGGLILWQRFGPRPSREVTAEPVTGRIEAAELPHRLGTGPIVLVEFADFQCPYCERFHTDVFPQIRRELVDTGRLTFAHVDVPLPMHPLALPAAKVGACSDGPSYWSMHDTLYRTVKDGSFVVPATLQPCVDATTIETKLADRFKVQGTPTFFLGTLAPDGAVILRSRFNGGPSLSVLTTAVAAVTRS